MINLHAFIDELEKIAFGPDDALKVFKATRGRMVRLPKAFMPTGPYAAGKGAINLMRKHLANLRAQGTAESSLQSGEKLLDLVKNKIVFPKGGQTADLFKGGPLAEKAKGFSPLEHRMSNAVMKGHELAEVPRLKPGSLSFGHAKGVIPIEHNMLTTLPKGVEKTRELYQSLRALEGPAPGISTKDLFEAATGGRIAYGAGQRLSRHARKRVAQRMEELAQQQDIPGVRM